MALNGYPVFLARLVQVGRNSIVYSQELSWIVEVVFCRKKRNEWDFRLPLCTYRLNWTRIAVFCMLVTVYSGLNNFMKFVRLILFKGEMFLLNRELNHHNAHAGLMLGHRLRGCPSIVPAWHAEASLQEDVCLHLSFFS